MNQHGVELLLLSANAKAVLQNMSGVIGADPLLHACSKTIDPLN
jgi:hypothetical protein